MSVQVLPDGHPVRRLRRRGRVHVPLGGPLQGARLGWFYLDARLHRRSHRGPRILLEEGSSRMGALNESSSTIATPGGPAEGGFFTTKFNDALQWAQKYSLFMYPFVTACCGMEFMAVSSPRYDFSRFGSEAPRFFAAPVGFALGRRHDRSATKRRSCAASTSRWPSPSGCSRSALAPLAAAFYDNYATVAGLDKIIPCDRVRARLSAASRSGARRPALAPRQDPER